MPASNSDLSRLNRALLALMGVLLVGASIALLDRTIVAVAIADLVEAFDTTVQAAQRATTAYLPAMAAAIPMMGWLTDRWGFFDVALVVVLLLPADSPPTSTDARQPETGPTT